MIDNQKKKKHDKIIIRDKVKINFYGEELIEKTVMSQGRVYLPKAWIGEKVKIVRC